MTAEPLTLMTQDQRDSYAARLETWARGKRGRMGDFLRRSAQIARGGFYQDAPVSQTPNGTRGW